MFQIPSLKLLLYQSFLSFIANSSLSTVFSPPVFSPVPCLPFYMSLSVVFLVSVYLQIGLDFAASLLHLLFLKNSFWII